MPDGVVSWLHVARPGRGGTEIFLPSVHNFSFHHQLSNQPAGGITPHIITHTKHIYNIIVIHAFLLASELQMPSPATSRPAADHISRPNSAASSATGLHTLAPSSLSL